MALLQQSLAVLSTMPTEVHEMSKAMVSPAPAVVQTLNFIRRTTQLQVTGPCGALPT